MAAIDRAKAGTKATRAMLNKQRKDEFRWTQDVLSGVYGNLRSTMGGGSAQLTAEQARLMGSLTKLRKNQARNSTRITNTSRANVSNLYGSATTGSVRTQLDTTSTAGRAGTRAVDASMKSGNILARGNTAAYKSLQQGARAAEAGAAAMTADALAYRAKNDASLIAERQNAIAMARLQNQLDLQNYKAKLRLEEKQKGLPPGASALAEFSSGAVPQLLTYFNDESLAKEGSNKVTALAAAQEYARDNGIEPGTAQYQVVLAAAQAIRASSDSMGKDNGNWDASAVADAVSQQLAIMYPDLTEKQVNLLSKSLLSSSSTWVLDQETIDSRNAGGEHVVVDRSGSQVRDGLGNIGYVQEDGSIKWLS